MSELHRNADDGHAPDRGAEQASGTPSRADIAASELYDHGDGDSGLPELPDRPSDQGAGAAEEHRDQPQPSIPDAPEPNPLLGDLQGQLGSGIEYQSFDDRPVLSDPHDPGLARQGYLGDCWLIASVNAVVGQRPDWPAETVSDNGDGTATVRLLESAPGPGGERWRERLSRTSFDLPSVDGATPVLARHDGGDLWPSLVEKACAGRDRRGYESLDGGAAVQALPVLTGAPAEHVDTGHVQDVVPWLGSLQDEGRPVVAGSLFQHQLIADPSLEALRQDANVYAAHEYTVRSADVQNDTGSLHNPWGFDHPRQLSGDEFQRLFPDVSVGSFPEQKEQS